MTQNWKPLWIVAELAGGEWTEKLKTGINECDEEGLQEPSFEDYLIRSLKEFCEAYIKSNARASLRAEATSSAITSPPMTS